MITPNSTCAHILKQLRVERGLGTEELANMLNMPEKKLQQIENDHWHITLPIISDYARELKIPAFFILIQLDINNEAVPQEMKDLAQSASEMYLNIWKKDKEKETALQSLLQS